MIIYLIIIFILVLLDQITKIIVMHNMSIAESITIIPNFFKFHYVTNTGAAWSKFQGQMVFFYIITTVALAVFFYYLIKEGNIANKKLYTISLLLIIAGTIGNYIDRILYQKVVDFLDFYIFGYDFPVFNVADSLLTIGVIGFAISVLFLTD